MFFPEGKAGTRSDGAVPGPALPGDHHHGWGAPVPRPTPHAPLHAPARGHGSHHARGPTPGHAPGAQACQSRSRGRVTGQPLPAAAKLVLQNLSLLENSDFFVNEY